MANHSLTQDLFELQVPGHAIPTIMITSPSPSNSVRESSPRPSSTGPVLHFFEDWRPLSANCHVTASSTNTGLLIDHARPQKRDSALGTRLCALTSQTSGHESDSPYASVRGWDPQYQGSPYPHKGNRKLLRWWRRDKAILNQENQNGSHTTPNDINIENGESTCLQVAAVRSGSTVPIEIRQYDTKVSRSSRRHSRSRLLAETWSETVDLDLLTSYEEVYCAVVQKALDMAFTRENLKPEDIAGALFLKVWRGEHHIVSSNWEELREWCKMPGAKFKFEYSILPRHVRVWKRVERMMDASSNRLAQNMRAGVRKVGVVVADGLKTLVSCATTTEMHERDRIAVWN